MNYFLEELDLPLSGRDRNYLVDFLSEDPRADFTEEEARYLADDDLLKECRLIEPYYE